MTHDWCRLGEWISWGVIAVYLVLFVWTGRRERHRMRHWHALEDEQMCRWLAREKEQRARWEDTPHG